jgi:hypothetical protein
MRERLVMTWKGYESKQYWPNFKLISQNLPENTLENYNKPPLGQPASRPRFKPGTIA